MDNQKHKKAKSYNEPGHAHELTFTCFHSLKLLSKDRTRQWFIKAMRCARRDLNLHLWAYVIMPEHVHLLFWPREEDYKISEVRTALKAPVGRNAVRYLRRHSPHFLEKLRDEQPNGKVCYRFWQRGGGYDRNAIDAAIIWQMIESVRRGLVERATDWIWSSARFYAGIKPVPIEMDDLPFQLDIDLRESWRI